MADNHSDANGAGEAPVLDIRDLHVYYGSAHVVQGANLTLKDGILAIVGRNGMGKTTLCKAIMGLVGARRGSIRFAGKDIAGYPAHKIAKLGVGYVPQGRRLWPSLNVSEHLTLAIRKNRKLDDGKAWDIDEIYQTFPRLAERRKNKSAQLSGGEQQMLTIARALLTNPRLLIMDEPTEGLSPVIVSQMEGVIKDLNQSRKMQILIIEQNIGVATAVSDFTAVMTNGHIGRLMPSDELATDRQLQKKLLGVGT